MINRVFLVALLALACHAQIFRLNVGLPQNCAPPASPQLAYMHQIIAPTFVPTPQPAPQQQTRVCDCGHNQVPVPQPIVTPIIPQACGPIVKPPAPAPVPTPVPSPVPQPSKCRDEEDSSSDEESSSEDDKCDERKGRKCDRCDKDEKNCKCGSCLGKGKDHRRPKEDKVKDLVKGGKSCDKCKGGKCDCGKCKCDSCKDKPVLGCKDKPVLNVIKPILGLINH